MNNISRRSFLKGGAVSAAAAALIPSNEAALLGISQIIVPGASLVIIFVILPALLLISRLRRP